MYVNKNNKPNLSIHSVFFNCPCHIRHMSSHMTKKVRDYINV